MGGAVIAIAMRLWKLQQPILLRSDPTLNDDLSEEEKKLIRPLYEEAASLNDVRSLLAYESRAHRLERAARWLPQSDASQVAKEADLIQAEILATFARARLRVLRSRVTDTLTSGAAIWLYILFGVGVLLFGLAADWLQSERTDKITVAKACADARAVASTVEEELPAICGDAVANTMAPSTPYLERAKANSQLASALVDCLAVAEDEHECDSINDAMDSLLPP
jgi:hypothetical protein